MLLLIAVINVLLLVLVALLVVIVYPSLFVDAIVWPKLVDLLMLVLEFLVCCSCRNSWLLISYCLTVIKLRVYLAYLISECDP